MLWLIIAILAYFFFALSSLGDRYLLIGPPNPKTYAFYVGILSIVVLALFPFLGFSIPGWQQAGLSLLYGLVFILALLSLYGGLERFEVSRIIPALGGFLPVFTFLLAFLFLTQEGFFSYGKVFSFCLLVLGGIFVSRGKSFGFSLKSLFFSALAALFLSLCFIISKIIYSDFGFWPGFIWMRLGVFVIALFLILFKDVRKEIFTKKKSFSKKTGFVFLGVQAVGAGAVVLQNWSIALANDIYVPFVSALQGVQYLFLFVLSLLFYKVLKEDTSKKIIFQKVFAIILILAGLIILAYE
jgi:drug/metabolite transporter (DMT)-like permease